MDSDQPMLKSPEIQRDEMGRFDRHGKTLSKTGKKTGLIKSETETKPQHGGFRPGSGRKPGSKNKITLALKEAVLAALDKVGGEEYLAKLAIENSSAFASLLGKILPHTIAPASETDGGGAIQFERIIVMPGGHRHIEGKTPLQIAPPPSQDLPNEDIARLPVVGENASSEPDIE
jgi:hypothetical protein